MVPVHCDNVDLYLGPSDFENLIVHQGLASHSQRKPQMASSLPQGAGDLY